MNQPIEIIETLAADLADCGYIVDTELATTLHLSSVLDRPILLEGDAGVGKTAVAVALAKQRDCELIRLQCYEGLDSNTALYEWNYQKQLMSVRLTEYVQDSAGKPNIESEIFSEDYLLQRPLLRAINSASASVLLIDEIDRADDEFEAFLLEVLAEFQITIPEIGTIKAIHKPTVILTSNATRDLSDALRRRCLYHYVDYPTPEKEMQILHSHLPELRSELTQSIVSFVQNLRRQNLKKTPGIAETLDWAQALMHLKTDTLDTSLQQIEQTLGCLLKTRSDKELADRDFINEVLNFTNKAAATS